MNKPSEILPFGMKIVVALIVISLLMLIGGFSIAYLGDDVKTVPLNERSYPPPKTN
ncbi:MAG: hypothetical protein ACR2GD_02820 [Pyrinomonadaceae bacterium]